MGLIYVNILKVELFISIHILCKLESLQAVDRSWVEKFKALYIRWIQQLRTKTNTETSCIISYRMYNYITAGSFILIVLFKH